MLGPQSRPAARGGTRASNQYLPEEFVPLGPKITLCKGTTLSFFFNFLLCEFWARDGCSSENMGAGPEPVSPEEFAPSTPKNYVLQRYNSVVFLDPFIV